MSIHTASRVSRVASFAGLGFKVRVTIRVTGLVGLWLGLVGLPSQACSHVYLCGVPIHTATGVASRVYSISLRVRVKVG